MSPKKLIAALSLCLAGLVLTCSVTYAQNLPISSLLSRLKHSPADTSRVIIYKNIVSYYRNSKPDSGIFYANQGLLLATRLKYSYGIAWMHGQLGAINVTKGKMDSAQNHLTIALTLFKKIKNRAGLVSANNSLGICVAKQGYYKQATEYFLAALKINQDNNDTHGLVQSYIKLGVLNDEINNQDKALEYFNNALKLNQSLPRSNAESTILNNIAICYAKKNQMKPALKYFLDGIKKADDKEPELMAMLLGNAGSAYEKLGNIKAAFNYEYLALKLIRKVHLPEAEATTLINLASLKSKTKPDSSLLLLKQALVITRQIHQHHVRLDAYQGMVDLYKIQGKYKEAEQTLEIKNALSDSLFTLKNAKDIAGLQANNDLANSKIKVQKLQLINQHNKFETWIILSFAICAVVVLVIVMLFYENSKKLNKQLILQQEELRSLNSFKDKLFSIIGHDLRSPVATIISLLSFFEDEDYTAAELREFMSRLKEQSLSTLDVMDKLLMWGKAQLKGISQNESLFNAKDVIVKNLNLYKETAEQKHITLIDKTPDEIMILADHTHVDFIIRNLLANAIKYTHTGGQVEVLAIIGDPEGHTTLAIKDNGIGIEKALQGKIFDRGNQSMEGTESEKGNSIGLMLCKEFVERNEGKIWLESELKKGTTFSVCFKQ